MCRPARTNKNTANAVQRYINDCFEDDGVLAICYPDDQRTGYHSKVTIDFPDGGQVVIRDWFGAHLRATNMQTILKFHIERAFKHHAGGVAK